MTFVSENPDIELRSELRNELRNDVRSSTRNELRSPAPSGATAGSDHPRLHVARAELVLARGLDAALRHVPLRPDPLSPFAEAVRGLREDLGDRADIVIDLLPLNAAKARHLARHQQRAHHEPSADWLTRLKGTVDPLNAPPARSRRPPNTRAAETKFDALEPVFAIQLLLRAESQIDNRAQGILHKLLAAADQFSADNYFRVAGTNLLITHWGADSWLHRRDFDRRFASGQISRGRRDQLVTAGEIAGLLKPPTKHCTSANVARSGGFVPSPPRDLPIYHVGDRDVVPLGYALGPDGREVLLGMHLDELLFSFRIGKSGFGKTELALVDAVALGLAGHGFWFLDPHGDGWNRIKPLLAGENIRGRIWEIDLTGRDQSATLASWNLLSMEGMSRESIEDKVDMVVTSFAACLSWADSAPRAKTLLTKTCETLCELAVQLPPELAPTIFQIPRLLEDELWRDSVLAFLPPNLQRYWEVSFPRIPPEATSPVTNLLNRLRSSPTMSAFFGASRSSYDVRRAMDTGAIVMLCPPGEGEIAKLVGCFLIYDLFRAGRSRGDMPAASRRRFDAFIDELTQVDGAARGSIAAILEQLRKFKVHLHAMTQMADRLTEDTRRALLQNQSMLASTAGGDEEVRVATRQWGKEVEPSTVSRLPRYHHIVSVQHHGQATKPFRIRGPEVTELFRDIARPDLVAELPEVLDRNLHRSPRRDTLRALDQLEDRIVSWLSANARPQMRDPTAHRHLRRRRRKPHPNAPRTRPRRRRTKGPAPAPAVNRQRRTHRTGTAPQSNHP